MYLEFGIGMSLPNITWRKWSAEEVNSQLSTDDDCDEDDGETPDTSYHSVIGNTESICLADINYQNVVSQLPKLSFIIKYNS